MLAVDNGITLPLKHMVDGAIDLPMGLGPDSWADHLYVAGHGGQNRAARIGVQILEAHIVIRTCRSLTDPPEGLIGGALFEDDCP